MLLELSMAVALAAQDDVADVPSRELQPGANPDMKAFLIGTSESTTAPAAGFAAVLVLPGGDGGANFLTFVKRLYKHSAPKDAVFIQLVAKEWNPGQFQILVWPTELFAVKNMKHTTEDLAEAALAEAGKSVKIDPARVYSLSWSSGGPAAYCLALRKKKLVAGSLVAMSVFPSQKLDLKAAAGHALFLYHSREDKICRFSEAEKAKTAFETEGAKVELVEYEGGHGWRGPMYPQLKAGFDWLERNRAR